MVLLAVHTEKNGRGCNRKPYESLYQKKPEPHNSQGPGPFLKFAMPGIPFSRLVLVYHGGFTNAMGSQSHKIVNTESKIPNKLTLNVAFFVSSHVDD